MRLGWNARWAMAMVDLVTLLIFVAIGRSTHDHGVQVFGVLSTLWPFAVGLAAGWLVIISRSEKGVSLRDGIIVCLVTVSGGMILRVVAGQGTAVAFILVALGFLGALMLGWRILVAVIVQRRR